MSSLADQIQSIRKLKPFLDAVNSVLSIAESAQSLAGDVASRSATISSLDDKIKESSEALLSLDTKIIEANQLAETLIENARVKAKSIRDDADASCDGIMNKTNEKAKEIISLAKSEAERFSEIVSAAKNELDSIKKETMHYESKLSDIRAAIAKAKEI